MTLAEFLAEVIGTLEAASIDYMIGGSVASSIYGEPRTTRDVDIVVEVTDKSLASLVSALDPTRMYVDEPLRGQSVASGQMYNILDIDGGWKADLVVRKARQFSVVEFSRRRRLNVLRRCQRDHRRSGSCARHRVPPPLGERSQGRRAA